MCECDNRLRRQVARLSLDRVEIDDYPTYKGIPIYEFDHVDLMKICYLFAKMLARTEETVERYQDRALGENDV